MSKNEKETNLELLNSPCPYLSSTKSSFFENNSFFHSKTAAILASRPSLPSSGRAVHDGWSRDMMDRATALQKEHFVILSERYNLSSVSRAPPLSRNKWLPGVQRGHCWISVFNFLFFFSFFLFSFSFSFPPSCPFVEHFRFVFWAREPSIEICQNKKNPANRVQHCDWFHMHVGHPGSKIRKRIECTTFANVDLFSSVRPLFS